jgi:hypothetical protein
VAPLGDGRHLRGALLLLRRLLLRLRLLERLLWRLRELWLRLRQLLLHLRLHPRLRVYERRCVSTGLGHRGRQILAPPAADFCWLQIRCLTTFPLALSRDRKMIPLASSHSLRA